MADATPSASMPALTPAQVEAIVHANAAALGLHIAAGHRPGVLAFFALAAGMAQLVDGMALDVEDEPAAVFTPVAPREDA